ncbi:MAG TPA: hypothetical protein VGL82_21625 [Bryobacteraceae bacterium]|jgi:hypothetical protein
MVLPFLGGILTILSACILPVLPFVFAKADQPFLSGGLPSLVGMSLTFAGFAAISQDRSLQSCTQAPLIRQPRVTRDDHA